ncbi:CHASE2 domain-containing protein [Bdellovibrionota bacterium]
MKIRSSTVLVFVFTLLFALLLVFQEKKDVSIKVVSAIEDQLLDLKFKLRGPLPAWNEQVIIGVDDRSLARLGRLPWPRTVAIEFYKKLKAYQPKAVALDIIYADPDRSAERAQNLFADVQKKYRALHPTANKKFIQFSDQVASELQLDSQLADAIRGVPNAVGGFYNVFSEEEAVQIALSDQDLYTLLLPSEIQTIYLEAEIKRTLYQSEGVRLPMPEIAKAIRALGFVELQADPDGSIRNAILIMQRGFNFYPSLPLQFASFLEKEPISLHFDSEGVKKILLGDREIPVDRFGRLAINFPKKPPAYKQVSFYDVYQGEVDPAVLKDKVVWVGATAPTILSEQYKTPFSTFTSGVELHATITENLVKGNYLNRPKNAWIFELLLILFLGAGMILVNINPLWTMLSTLGLMAVIFFFDSLFLFSRNLFFHDAIPLLQLAVTYTLVSAYRFFVEEREDRHVRNAFRHYVSPVVADKIMETPEELTLGGDRKNLTVLFTDIRGFTPLSEKMPPHELTRFLNDYMSEMTQAVFNHQGLLDKYMGDALLAIFGAPVPDPEHPLHACEAAIEMIERLEEIRQKGPVPDLECGIGINTGEMIVGNMGSRDVFDYTVVGDNVNLCSRLEKSNKVYGTRIVLSEETYHKVQEKVLCRELDLIRVRGKEIPARIFELLAVGEGSENQKQLVKTFHEGLKAYRSSHWDEAIKRFEKCLKIKPDDKPSTLFIPRCESYKEIPPEETWGGVYKMS